MKYEQQRAEFDRDGFTVVREFLVGQELAELNNNLDRYIREIVPTLPDSHAFYQDKTRPETLKQMQNMQGDSFFDEYRKNPHWLAFGEALLGEAVHSQGPEWFNKPPGIDHRTPPHQDNYYFNLTPPSVVTAWLALDDIDEHNGCLRYVRGSHRKGLRQHDVTSVLGFSQGITDYGPEDESQEVLIRLRPGDLVAHHGVTIHRAEPNQSNRQRRAFALVMRGESCRLDDQGNQRYLDAARKQQTSMGLESSMGLEPEIGNE